MLPNLTKKEREVLRFITNFIKRNQFSPSVREIADFFNIAPKNAHKYLKILHDKGYIKKEKNISRGISVTLNKTPLISTAQAGFPLEFQEITDEFYEIDPNLFPQQNIVLVNVMGDSMINAHIKEGDIAVVSVDSDISTGDIVVASIFNELTLKRYAEKNGKLFLIPENDNYKAMEIDNINSEELKIIGKVVGIIRKIP